MNNGISKGKEIHVKLQEAKELLEKFANDPDLFHKEAIEIKRHVCIFSRLLSYYEALYAIKIEVSSVQDPKFPNKNLN